MYICFISLTPTSNFLLHLRSKRNNDGVFGKCTGWGDRGRREGKEPADSRYQHRRDERPRGTPTI